MFLADHDIQHALERVQAAFPSFTQWTYTNASDDERSLDGFSLWGQWVLQPEECMARHFYITFATHAEHWSGHLTIGQYFGSLVFSGVQNYCIINYLPNMSTFQHPEKRVQRCARPLRFHSISPM